MANFKINKTKDRGFTIVELLVVIVVIGILAAITIVSYTGVTAKANTAANKSNAASVVSAAMGVYAESGAYPTTSAAPATMTGYLNTGVTKVPASLNVSSNAVAAGSSITYAVKGSTGICVGYWDYVTGGGSVAWLYAGDATIGTNATPSTCA